MKWKIKINYSCFFYLIDSGRKEKHFENWDAMHLRKLYENIHVFSRISLLLTISKLVSNNMLNIWDKKEKINKVKCSSKYFKFSKCLCIIFSEYSTYRHHHINVNPFMTRRWGGGGLSIYSFVLVFWAMNKRAYFDYHSWRYCSKCNNTVVPIFFSHDHPILFCYG